MFSVATNALRNHPKLKNVTIMEHAPRHDLAAYDPTHLKSNLAKFANSTFNQLWHSSGLRDKIMIGKHSISSEEVVINDIYKNEWSGRYDGLHMLG